eukprot:scaffold14_cov380-Prasinococcus_capsulatus_cf.AAC.2
MGKVSGAARLSIPCWNLVDPGILVTCAWTAATEYAQVIRMLGNGRLEAQCVDGVKRLCHIRGKMRKKVWVNTVRGGLRAPIDLARPLYRVCGVCACCLCRCCPSVHGVTEDLSRLFQGDIILVGLRDFQDEKADVIQKYMADEARSLKAYGELPDTSKPT